ncbi:proteasome ATPase [Micrococcus sp.]|uniref:proteasome ATPase n=1 Tax=Micrococcus sp. TaxID=1271 RepID=UPI0026DC63D9|nr:proteasome ATPase [Micrococcus sp.]MDO4238623.1 proteasome ATPase [Micrococcus sp.]
MTEHPIGSAGQDGAALRRRLEEARELLRQEQSRAERLQHQLDAAQRHGAQLSERRREARAQLDVAARNNRRMVDLLEATRGEITTLKEALDATTKPPFTFARLESVLPPREPVEGVETGAVVRGGADVVQNGRRLRVSVSPLLEPERLTPGAEVLLDESSTVVGVADASPAGQLLRVKEVLDSGDLVLAGTADEERLVRRAPALEGVPLRHGDAVTVDPRIEWALRHVELSEVDDVLLEEVPDVTFEDIGGLGPQIERIREAVEIPFLHPEVYREHGLRAPKGIMLYGPPGTGKTMLAKAVANALSARSADGSRSFFLNIKGPELLNKYVGETERQIRIIFDRARERAAAGFPVVVFFDEMESLFRTRGSGVSSDVETTIVPQLLAEIDGVESLDNVIVIGASNREDMIDPAVLRPGRLDVKIRVDRPDARGAVDIMARHLTDDVPLHADEVAAAGDAEQAREDLIAAAVTALYERSPRTALAELTDVTGAAHTLHLADLVSGAVVADVVDRAKRSAVRDLLAADMADDARGLRQNHLLDAVDAVLADQADLLSTVAPGEWARTSGWRGPRLAGLRMLPGGTAGAGA